MKTHALSLLRTTRLLSRSGGTSLSAYIFEQTYGDRLGTLDVTPKIPLHFDMVRAWLQTTDISNAQVKLRIYKVSTALDPLPSGALIAESQLATVGETASEVSFSFGSYVDLSVGDRYVFAFTVDGHTWNYPDTLRGWGHAASSGCDFWEHFIEYDDHTGATPNDIYTTTNQLAISFVDTTPLTSAVFTITATDADKLEGNNSAQNNSFLFKIDRTGDISQSAQIKWQVTTQNPGVAANDFSTGVLPSGIAQFDAGVSTYNLPISIFGDKVYELDESFSVKLSDAPANATIDPNAGMAQGVIRNDDEALVLKNVIPRFSHPLISAAYLADAAYDSEASRAFKETGWSPVSVTKIGTLEKDGVFTVKMENYSGPQNPDNSLRWCLS